MDILVLQFEKFLLVLARISGLFFTAPLFSSPNIPYPIKAGLILLISLVVAPISIGFIGNPPENMMSLAILVTSEILIGLLIGLFAQFIVSLFTISGEFYSVPMGFAISNVYDPMSEVEQPVIGQLIGLFGLLVFVTIGGPQTILYAVINSFKSVSLFSFSQANIISVSVIELFCKMFTTALKIAIPMVAVLFLVNLSLGLLSKAAPLINVMVVGFPITIIAGLITLFFIFPVLYSATLSIFDGLFSDIDQLLARL
ncbi:MAG: flagellar biosynthetic protein FliR [bacterium]|nr:flagellar biosynthetic protein FliR [bacterium]